MHVPQITHCMKSTVRIARQNQTADRRVPATPNKSSRVGARGRYKKRTLMGEEADCEWRVEHIRIRQGLRATRTALRFVAECNPRAIAESTDLTSPSRKDPHPTRSRNDSPFFTCHHRKRLQGLLAAIVGVENVDLSNVEQSLRPACGRGFSLYSGGLILASPSLISTTQSLNRQIVSVL
jgi:hypothetical protein